MIELLTTTDKLSADICEMFAKGEFGKWNVYVYKYKNKDGYIYKVFRVE